MNKLSIIAIIFIFLGEAMMIYAEVISAKHGIIQAKLQYYLLFNMFIIMVIASALLIGGYLFGILAFKDIWIVSVASITSIIITEPIVNYFIFGELPGLGPAIGFILGIIGLIISLTIK